MGILGGQMPEQHRLVGMVRNRLVHDALLRTPSRRSRPRRCDSYVFFGMPCSAGVNRA
jgi:hypothetical protein